MQTQETQDVEQDVEQGAENTATTPPIGGKSGPKPRRRMPTWAAFSVAANGLLLLSVALLYWKPELLNLAPPEVVVTAADPNASPAPEETTPPQSQYTYEQWLEILGKEAKAVAKAKPERLTVLLGDSLSLWFPTELLPGDRVWLNQGVSGENSASLLRRLNLLDELQPETIVVMVGINDLIKGTADEQILENYRKIVQVLKEKHPKSAIVVNSVLPHGGDRVKTTDREQVLTLSNERIYQFNQKLSGLMSELEVRFLDLHPLFLDGDGLMHGDLSTDGVHLKRQGYVVWRSAFQVFSQLLLPKPVKEEQGAPTTEVSPAATSVEAAPAEVNPAANPESITPELENP
jgi:lysophospholipase L1-like esterase